MKTLLTDLQHSIAQAPEHRHCHMTCEMVYVKRGRARFSMRENSSTCLSCLFI